MDGNRSASTLSRRQFLIGQAAAAAWLLAHPNPLAAIDHSISTVPVAPEPADLVLRGGRIITVDPSDSIAEAVAIKGDVIQAVGTSAEIAPLVGPATRVVDLRGKTLTPGLIDAHNHFQITGLLNGYYEPFLPPDVKSIQDLTRKLAEVIAQKPKGEWIQGYYLILADKTLPTRQDLDSVSPEHPVWIMHQCGHYGSANSVALKMAGVTRDTPNPSGGVIERDKQGELTGVFYNHRAMDLLRKAIPPISMEMVKANIASTLPLFAACGVTSFQDNNVRGVDTVGTYLAAGKEGTMSLRGAVYYTLEWPADVQRAIKEVERYSDPYMRFAGFKFLLDGQALMAYCHQPHAGIRWDLPTWEPQSFKAAVRALHDTELQICVHCIGDAAVDLTLDAYEEAMNANPRPDPRHRIEHCVLSTPEATQRMKDLGVVVSTQPTFITLAADYWAGVFGPERTRRAIVTQEWLQGGVHLALGSDSPTTPWHTPAATLAAAISRITASREVHEPDQRLTIQQALRAHTMGSAYAAHEEKLKGSIEPGKLADLVLWGADPYAANPRQLLELPVLMTMVGGKVVYQDPRSV